MGYPVLARRSVHVDIPWEVGMTATDPRGTPFLDTLAATLVRITVACQGLDVARLHERPDDRTWSVNDNLAHLRACADVWGKSIRAMLADDGAPQRNVSPRQWIRHTNYPLVPFPESLASFTRDREELLALLRGLEDGEWARGAPIGGRTHTVFSQTRRMALHEVAHCEQIEALTASLREEGSR
jgi:hypothetical protein